MTPTRLLQSLSLIFLLVLMMGQKCGLALFVLYLVQISLGTIIHFFKPKGARHRPLQNYAHAVIGLLLVALALYQARVGYKHEWPLQTGRGPLPKAADVVWYIWVVVSATGLCFFESVFNAYNSCFLCSILLGWLCCRNSSDKNKHPRLLLISPKLSDMQSDSSS